jgi:tetratricopeptide (TPR) repeat protein
MEWCKILKSMVAGLAAVALLGSLTGCATKLEQFRKEGVRLYNEQEYDQSLAKLNDALREDQFDAVSNAYAGLIEYRADHLVQAEYHLRLALQADPSSEEAKAGLTATLIKQGKPDEALDALERAAKLAEGVEDPRRLKANIKVPYTKQVEERLFLGKYNDRIRIAKVYESLGDYDNAFNYYKMALEYRDDAGTLMAIGDLAERAQNSEQAREYYARAYEKNPAEPGLVSAMTRVGLSISRVIGSGGGGGDEGGGGEPK